MLEYVSCIEDTCTTRVKNSEQNNVDIAGGGRVIWRGMSNEDVIGTKERLICRNIFSFGKLFASRTLSAKFFLHRQVNLIYGNSFYFMLTFSCIYSTTKVFCLSPFNK